MALANPRKIVVQGTQYHWKVSKRNFHLVVIEPGTKRKLVVFFDEDNKPVITPKTVQDFILEAVVTGWTGEIRWRR